MLAILTDHLCADVAGIIAAYTATRDKFEHYPNFVTQRRIYPERNGTTCWVPSRFIIRDEFEELRSITYWEAWDNPSLVSVAPSRGILVIGLINFSYLRYSLIDMVTRDQEKKILRTIRGRLIYLCDFAVGDVPRTHFLGIDNAREYFPMISATSPDAQTINRPDIGDFTLLGWDFSLLHVYLFFVNRDGYINRMCVETNSGDSVAIDFIRKKYRSIYIDPNVDETI